MVLYNCKISNIRITNSQHITDVLLSFISTNFAMDFLFRSGLPLLVSNFELKEDIKITCENNAFILTDI